MEKSKNTNYCERCRENIDNSNFKKYGNICTICKVNQYYERKAKKFRRFLNTSMFGCQTILICLFLLKEIYNYNNTIYYYNHLYLS